MENENEESAQWEPYCWRTSSLCVFKNDQGKLRVSQRYSAGLPQCLISTDNKYAWSDWSPNIVYALFDTLEDVDNALNFVI